MAIKEYLASKTTEIIATSVIGATAITGTGAVVAYNDLTSDIQQVTQKVEKVENQSMVTDTTATTEISNGDLNKNQKGEYESLNTAILELNSKIDKLNNEVVKLKENQGKSDNNNNSTIDPVVSEPTPVETAEFDKLKEKILETPETLKGYRITSSQKQNSSFSFRRLAKDGKTYLYYCNKAESQCKEFNNAEIETGNVYTLAEFSKFVDTW